MKPTPAAVIETATGLLALLSLAAGLWAMLAPRSFHLAVAPFPPYSQHLVHDIGAFQLGLAGCLVAGLFLQDALVAVLAGNTVAAVAHFASHVLDRSAGGHTGDPATLGAIALLLTLLTLGAVADRNRSKPTGAAIHRKDSA